MATTLRSQDVQLSAYEDERRIEAQRGKDEASFVLQLGTFRGKRARESKAIESTARARAV